MFPHHVLSSQLSRIQEKNKKKTLCVRMLSLGLQMHMAPRILKTNGGYISTGIPNNGIIAGCAQSTSWAKTLLHQNLDEAQSGYEVALLKREARTFLDDIRLTERGSEGEKRGGA